MRPYDILTVSHTPGSALAIGGVQMGGYDGHGVGRCAAGGSGSEGCAGRVELQQDSWSYTCAYGVTNKTVAVF